MKSRLAKYLEMARMVKRPLPPDMNQIDDVLERELHNYGKDELIDMIYTYGLNRGFEDEEEIDSFDDDELIDILVSDLKPSIKVKLYNDIKRR